MNTDPVTAEKNASAEMTGREEDIRGKQISENIYLCADEKYRWIYEFAMLKNPAILFTIWKVMGFSFGIVVLFLIVVTLISGDFEYWESPAVFFGVMLLLLLVLMGLSFLAYLIVSARSGGKYLVLFTMDERGIEHRQLQRQVKKARALSWLAAAAGAAAGSFSTMGAGILAATREASFSEFEKVTSLRADRSAGIIYVNQGPLHNQIYAAPCDFDFVQDYIFLRCVNAKKRS